MDNASSRYWYFWISDLYRVQRFPDLHCMRSVGDDTYANLSYEDTSLARRDSSSSGEYKVLAFPPLTPTVPHLPYSYEVPTHEFVER